MTTATAAAEAIPGFVRLVDMMGDADCGYWRPFWSKVA